VHNSEINSQKIKYSLSLRFRKDGEKEIYSYSKKTTQLSSTNSQNPYP